MPQGGTELCGGFREDSSVSRRWLLPVSACGPHATSGSIDRRERPLFSLLPFRVAMPPKRPLPSPPGPRRSDRPSGHPVHPSSPACDAGPSASLPEPLSRSRWR